MFPNRYAMPVARRGYDQTNDEHLHMQQKEYDIE